MSQVVAMRFLSVMSVKCCLAMVSAVSGCQRCVLLPSIVLELHFDISDVYSAAGNRS